MIRSNILILMHDDMSDSVVDFLDTFEKSKNNISNVVFWKRMGRKQYMNSVSETFEKEMVNDDSSPIIIFSDLKNGTPYQAALTMMETHKDKEIYHITNFNIGILVEIIMLSIYPRALKKTDVLDYIKDTFEHCIPEVTSNVPSNNT